jgi:hypothetical protein
MDGNECEKIENKEISINNNNTILINRENNDNESHKLAINNDNVISTLILT